MTSAHHQGVISPAAIAAPERRLRVERLADAMAESDLAAVLLGSTTNLRYFTGVAWPPSERLVGALVHASGVIEYICPGFERDKVGRLISLPGEVLTWEEDEDPHALAASRLVSEARLGVDDQVALFVFLGLRRAMGDARLADAGPLINRLRRQKSAAELALMRRAKAITLEVQRRTRLALQLGMMTSDVIALIDAEHRALGASGGSSFCLVSFGVDSCLPHGAEEDRALREGDIVLIDTGCRLDGYNSDITRTYVFGEADARVRAVWTLEKEAQAVAFEAAQLGRPCESVDAAARAVLEHAGYGPDYRLPGLPHRTGHGIGLDIHESPNLVRGDATPLAPGMCFSNEPMIVIPGAFGVRLEDHFYMSDAGPVWFTPPAASIDDPFASAPAFVRA